MRILLTGCNGQVGFLLTKLLKNKFDLLALSRKELDISDEYLVNKVVADFIPCVIINAAAYTAVDDAESDVELAFSINSEGSKCLAKAASNNNAFLIHISTDYVFDGIVTGRYIETDETNPQNIYGKSKLAGELAVREFCPNHIIIRTSWLFGEHGNNFIKTMLRLSKYKRTLNIVNDEFGGPTYAGDLAKAILKIIKRIEDNVPIKWGLYHYSGLPYVSWYDFAKQVIYKAEMAGLINSVPKIIPIPSKDFPTFAKRPKNSKLNCDEIKHEFGISPSNWQAELDNIKNYD